MREGTRRRKPHYHSQPSDLGNKPDRHSNRRGRCERHTSPMSMKESSRHQSLKRFPGVLAGVMKARPYRAKFASWTRAISAYEYPSTDSRSACLSVGDSREITDSTTSATNGSGASC